jgi:hypothetical protein
VHCPDDFVVDVVGRARSTSDEFDFVFEYSLFDFLLCERVGHLRATCVFDADESETKGIETATDCVNAFGRGAGFPRRNSTRNHGWILDESDCC